MNSDDATQSVSSHTGGATGACSVLRGKGQSASQQRRSHAACGFIQAELPASTDA